VKEEPQDIIHLLNWIRYRENKKPRIDLGIVEVDSLLHGCAGSPSLRDGGN